MHLKTHDFGTRKNVKNPQAEGKEYISMPTQTFFDLSEQKKNRILHAAYTEFADHPYEKVSIQSIIQTAKIPRGSFYQYFTDKEDLYVHCVTSLRQKIMEMVFRNEGLDFYWHRIYSPDTLSDTETPWFQNFTAKIYSILDETETRFMAALTSAPHNAMISSFCKDGVDIYYPYFSQVLEKEGSFSDAQNRDILAFFLAMGDFLAYEYSYAKNIPDQEAFACIRLGLKTLVDAYRTDAPVMLSEDAENTTDFLTAVQTKLNALTLRSIHLMSRSGTDTVIPLLPGNSWELCQVDKQETSVLRIHVDSDALEGSVSLSLHNTQSPAVPTETDAETDCLTFSFTDAGGSSPLLECRLTGNGISYSLSTPDLIGIGTKKDGAKVCLIENGGFVL